MSPASVFHLEKLPRFRRRVVELNRMHDPDNPLHAALLLDKEGWERHVAGLPLAEAARLSRARRAVAAIHASFPGGAPLPDQAAYLVRAFSGLRPFDQANHRTGWDFLAELVEHSGHALLATEADGRALGNEVYERLSARYGEDGFEVAHLSDEDDTAAYLREWFRHKIG